MKANILPTDSSEGHDLFEKVHREIKKRDINCTNINVLQIKEYKWSNELIVNIHEVTK
jgi:hypothetical protein